jgi:hypothetical protein
MTSSRESPTTHGQRFSHAPFVWVLGGSAAAWILLTIVIPPGRQNFPLADDWAFSQSAFLFARGQGFHYRHWSAMPQLGQWLWAWPFIKLFGENLVVLRWSTILLSWLGLWSLYQLFCREGLESARAAWLTAGLAFCPLFFVLQGTFMTDVPALSFSLIALDLYAAAASTGQWAPLAGAAVMATVAGLTRQSALAAALTGAVLVLMSPAFRPPTLWRIVRLPVGLAAALVPLAIGLAMHQWLQHRTGATGDIVRYRTHWFGPTELFEAPFLVFHFCGLMVLPVTLFELPRRGLYWFVAALAALGAVAWYLWWPNYSTGGAFRSGGAILDPLFPYYAAVLAPGGPFTGPLQVGTAPEFIGMPLRIAGSVLGCFAGAVLVVRIVERVHAFKLDQRMIFHGTVLSPLMIFTCLQLPLLFLGFGPYDRYFVNVLPGALLLAGTPGRPQRPSWAPRIAVMAVFAALSTALMHDWLSWNSARWTLGQRALDKGWAEVPSDIEGGFEWNGWDAPEPRPVRPVAKPRLLRLAYTVRFFPHVDGRVALSFSELKGTRVLDSEPYSLWLVPGEHEFLLLGISQPPPRNDTRPRNQER